MHHESNTGRTSNVKKRRRCRNTSNV